MKKPQNKKGILLTEILVAMVLITLIVVGGFQAVKSWKDSTHQYNTVQTLITHIPAALDQVMVRKSIDADEVTVALLGEVTAQAEKTSWDGAITDCPATETVAGIFCIDVALPSDIDETDFANALADSVGNNSAIDSATAGTDTIKVKYAR